MGGQHGHGAEPHDHSHGHQPDGRAGRAFRWSIALNSGLTAHVVIDPDHLQREGLSRDQLLASARRRLEAFGIRKSTLQLESAAQTDAAL
jgi:hypothetical protein